MQLPYFEGDKWPEVIEECIMMCEEKSNLKRAKSTSGNTSVVDRLFEHLKKDRDMFFTISLFTPYQEKMLLLEKPQIVDPDPLISCELVDTRINFLEKSREEHWQFSHLRLAKWSTLELCHMLHRQDSCHTCNLCKQPARYHCSICQVISFSNTRNKTGLGLNVLNMRIS
jgi:E1A/CREB-binding protein